MLQAFLPGGFQQLGYSGMMPYHMPYFNPSFNPMLMQQLHYQYGGLPGVPQPRGPPRSDDLSSPGAAAAAAAVPAGPATGAGELEAEGCTLGIEEGAVAHRLRAGRPADERCM